MDEPRDIFFLKKCSFKSLKREAQTRRMERRKNRASAKSQSTKSPRDLQRCKHLKSKCQRIIWQASNTYMQIIDCHDVGKTPTKFWSLVKSKKQDASGASPWNNDQDDLCSDKLAKSNIIDEHFKPVFTNEGISTMLRLSKSSYPTISHITIDASGVEKLPRKRNPHRDTGLDAIPAHLLCELSAEVTPALSFVFQMSFDTCQIPDDWRMA